MKTVQYFTGEYLEQCRRMTPDQIIRFVEDFRRLHGVRAADAPRRKSQLSGRPYQTQIKTLMKDWVTGRG